MKKILLFIILILPFNCFALTKYKLDNTIVFISNNYININNDDILIIDDRQNNNMQIVNSYRITNKKTQDRIIDIILKYNKEYPYNNWTRSKNTMKLEWYIHNFLYSFNLYKNSTKSVDFHSSEEFFYKILCNYLQI